MSSVLKQEQIRKKAGGQIQCLGIHGGSTEELLEVILDIDGQPISPVTRL